MFYNRSLIYVVILAVVFVLIPKGLLAQPTQKNPLVEDQLYQIFTDYYFFRREAGFAREMSKHETFLRWLYDGIISEVKKRKKEDLYGSLRAITPPELVGFDESNYALPENFDDSAANIYYLAWERFRRDEFNHKYIQARLIKSRLINSGTSSQRQRMFQFDLRQALNSYLYERYAEAVLRFNELIEEYGYKNVTDIIFYRAESYFTLQLLDRASQDYKYLIGSGENRQHHRKALQRLLAISGDNGDVEQALRYWEQYLELYGQTHDQEYWETSELAARYHMIAGNFIGARDIFDQIPPSSDVFIRARLFAAQCALSLIDLDDAEQRYMKLVGESLNSVRIDDETREQARLKNSYVSYLRGDYDLAFVNSTEVTGPAHVKENAEICSIWSIFKLEHYKHAIKIGQDFLKDYPNSRYLYEIKALIAFCYEKIDDDSTSLNEYRRILEVVDDVQEYRNINLEKSKIKDTVSELLLLEKELFVKGYRDLFPKYLNLRRNLAQLTEQIKLYEGYKSNPDIKEMVKERALLAKMLEDQADLEREIFESDEIKYKTKFNNIIADIGDLNKKIGAGIRYKLSKKNLIQQEQRQSFTKVIKDSLKLHYEKEQLSIDNTLNEIREVEDHAREIGDPELMIDLKGVEQELTYLKGQLLNIQKDICVKDSVEVSSHLEYWSEFANIRNIYSGIDFDSYGNQHVRLESLDNYIQRLNQILAVRSRVPEEFEDLPTELIPNIQPDVKTYTAPPTPMWISHTFDISNLKVIDEEPIEKPIEKPSEESIEDVILDKPMDMEEKKEGESDVQDIRNETENTEEAPVPVTKPELEDDNQKSESTEEKTPAESEPPSSTEPENRQGQEEPSQP